MDSRRPCHCKAKTTSASLSLRPSRPGSQTPSRSLLSHLNSEYGPVNPAVGADLTCGPPLPVLGWSQESRRRVSRIAEHGSRPHRRCPVYEGVARCGLGWGVRNLCSGTPRPPDWLATRKSMKLWIRRASVFSVLLSLTLQTMPGFSFQYARTVSLIRSRQDSGHSPPPRTCLPVVGEWSLLWCGSVGSGHLVVYSVQMDLARAR